MSARCIGITPCFGYTIGAEGDDLTFDKRDSAPLHAEVPGHRSRLHLGTRAVAAGALGPHDHLRNPCPRLYQTAPGGAGDVCAARSPASAARRWWTTSVRSASPSVELLPIHAFVNDSHLLDKGLTNYWGYNTIGFFAPDPRYSAIPDFVFSEFKEMVARLHDAGIEVILDVVYNHTAEGNESGPTLSFRGIDNASYYRLLPDQPRYYINDTGTGNTLNMSHPRVLQMVTDSLRYWASRDARRRFPLRSRHDPGARGCTASTKAHGFLESCLQDPVLSSDEADRRALGHRARRLPGRRIPAGLGRMERQVPRYRARATGRAIPASRPKWRRGLSASADSFARRGRKAWASVNFITAHDGFTLNDLVSYNEKHNEANGEDGRDGHSDNQSWNCGVEGPTDDPEIIALRERQKRNMLATLLLAQGTPMLLAGDEFGRTQQGNNNAYCQDNEISWVNWNFGEKEVELAEFVRKVIVLRQSFPILRRSRFLTGEYNPDLDVRDVRWLIARAARISRIAMARRQRPLLRHADGRPRAGQRHQAAGDGRDRAAGAERAS